MKFLIFLYSSNVFRIPPEKNRWPGILLLTV